MVPMRARKLEGVLLDVDGTLIDSNLAHARAWSDALREFGHEIPPDTIRSLIGMGGDKLLPKLTGVASESDEGERITDVRARIFLTAYVPTLRQTPGARALIDRLRQEGLRLVIATSANEDELSAMLKQVGLEDLRRRTTADDAERSKPDPDIIQAALAEGGLDASAAILLGDTPYDVEAARRASVDTVAMLCGGWGRGALSGAIGIYDDPADLVVHFTASPFASAA